MAEISQSMNHGLGCGLIGGIFSRKNHWLKKTTSLPSLPAKTRDDASNLPANENTKKHPIGIIKTGRSTSVDSAVLQSLSNQELKPNGKPEFLSPRNFNSQLRNRGVRPSDAARSSTSSSSSSSQRTRDSCNERKFRITVTDQPKLNDSKALVRANSNNIMLVGQMDNLRQPGNGSMLGNKGPNATIKTVGDLRGSLQLQEVSSKPKVRYGLGGISVMGNIMRQPGNELKRYQCSMSRLDPEALKNMGNDAYTQGNFEEALSFYEKAISHDPRKAVYWCNKGAALVGLGRLIDAFIVCKEAIRLDPNYHRAHHRLATIYLRLGEAEQAINHYNQAGEYADSKEISQTQALAEHLHRSNQARKSNEWNLLLKETQSAINSGADAAPLVFALQAEALIKLQRHQEAYAAHRNAPNFAIESCINFFGLSATAYLLMIRAEVYMVSGRFEDAAAAAQHASRLDLGNKEVAMVLRRTRLVSSARLSGNLLFKASKFLQACVVYTEGLQHEPHNSVLLCNRAACRSKLSQFEKAIEDCTAALNVQPSYSKARLRRADCYAKLEKWEAAIQDYETVIRETTVDEEVVRALLEAQQHLKKQRGQEVEDMNPSANFLKVEVEDNPYLGKSEGMNSIPAFNIYKNGSSVKEIPANNI